MAYGRIRATAATLRDYLFSQVAHSKHIADLANLPDMSIRWAIQQRFPDITTIFHKNEEDFGYNLVWYFGPPGDVAVEIGGSFLRATKILEDNGAATVTRASDLLTAMIKQEELALAQTPAYSQGTSEDTPQEGQPAPSKEQRRGRWLTALTGAAVIDAILLFTFAGLLIAHGIILVPAIVSGVVAIAILGTAIWSRAPQSAPTPAALDEG